MDLFGQLLFEWNFILCYIIIHIWYIHIILHFELFRPYLKVRAIDNDGRTDKKYFILYLMMISLRNM